MNPPARTKVPGSLTEMWPACATEALRAAAAAAASSLHLMATSDGSIDLGVDRSTELF